MRKEVINIVEVRTKGELDSFIRFPLDLYYNDPFYAPQLTKDLKTHFTEKNPFFKRADIKFFLAIKDKKVIGRIASIINYRHLEHHNEKVGFFGFFECINDGDVSNALLSRVSEELKNKGLDIIRGPMNFSTNEECGFLIEGFDSPPMIMTPYNPPYYNDLMDKFGMYKAKDLYAFIHKVQDKLPEKILRVASLAEKRMISVRPIDKRNFISDMKAFMDVYNSAWQNNWGFIPLTEDELIYNARRLKPLVKPELVLIAEDRGRPVGFLGLIPDFNLVLRKMKGRLNLMTLLKAIYYSRKITNLRLLLLGIKSEYRNKGVDAILFREAFKGVKKGDYRNVEFSWILEDNIHVIRLVEMAEGRLYKKYRVYEKAL